MNFARIVWVFIMVIGTYLFCDGKSGNDHFWDMVNIFPFDYNAQASNSRVFEFFKDVNQYLDNVNFPKKNKTTGHPRFIKDYPEFSKMKFANHRIWFHWGFNRNPKKFAPLRRIVDENIKNNLLDENDEYLFWKFLMKEVSRRNEILMSKWAKISGYSGLRQLSKINRDQSNAFVTILVAIHLLGDHTTTETGVIINTEDLYGEINDAIDKISGKGRGYNVEGAKALINYKELKAIRKSILINLLKSLRHFYLV